MVNLSASVTHPVTRVAPAALPRRLARLLAAITALVLVSALIVLAARPTGVPTAADVVPDGLRLASRQRVGDVDVLLATDGRAPRALVAYEGPKGWLDVELGRAPAGASAAWATTSGQKPVPALAAVWGRIDGAAAVQVAWADGGTTESAASTDGHYLVARAGAVTPTRVTARGPDGAPIETVALG